MQAGYGISIAVLCILSGCYFKNARNEMKPARAFPVWSIGVRLLIAPVRGLLLHVHASTVSLVAVQLLPCGAIKFDGAAQCEALVQSIASGGTHLSLRSLQLLNRLLLRRISIPDNRSSYLAP